MLEKNFDQFFYLKNNQRQLTAVEKFKRQLTAVDVVFEQFQK